MTVNSVSNIIWHEYDIVHPVQYDVQYWYVYKIQLTRRGEVMKKIVGKMKLIYKHASFSDSLLYGGSNHREMTVTDTDTGL